MKGIFRTALGLMVAGGISTAMAQTTPDTTAPPGQMAAPTVASGRGATVHSKNRKPKHKVGAPGPAASPSVSANKGGSGAPSGSAAPATTPGAPAEAAAPSVQKNR